MEFYLKIISENSWCTLCSCPVLQCVCLAQILLRHILWSWHYGTASVFCTNTISWLFRNCVIKMLDVSTRCKYKKISFQEHDIFSKERDDLCTFVSLIICPKIKLFLFALREPMLNLDIEYWKKKIPSNMQRAFLYWVLRIFVSLFVQRLSFFLFAFYVAKLDFDIEFWKKNVPPAQLVGFCWVFTRQFVPNFYLLWSTRSAWSVE